MPYNMLLQNTAATSKIMVTRIGTLVYKKGAIMSKNRKKTNDISNIPKNQTENDEEMTVTLDLEDGTTVTCSVVTILTVNKQDYIALLPLDEEGENEDGEVWFYRYSENEKNPNEEPELSYIDDDEEYEIVSDAFDEYLDNVEFDELLEGEEEEE